MRAVVVAGPGEARVERVARPEPKADEVRVRLEGSGLCGSDLAVWEGRPWFTYPLPPGNPGHEAWGVVDAVGADVSGYAVGDRVTGLFHQAFAEHAVTRASELLHVPDGVGDVPFAGEPLACAANAVRRSGLGAGDKVVVIGIGFIGAAITAFATACGAEVLAVSRRPYAQAVARQMGARDVLPFDAGTVEDHVASWTDGALADVVFEVTGKQAPLDLATRLTRVRGTLVIAGYHQDGPRHVDLQTWNWRGLDVVNAHERDPAAYMAGMRHALEWSKASGRDLASLYTHRFPLEEIGDAFTHLAERPDGFLKAVVTP